MKAITGYSCRNEVPFMIKCPSCGRALTGNPRACGYCGESLVSDYFSRPAHAESLAPAPAGAGGIAAMTLGIFGCAALFGAVVLHLGALFGYGTVPQMTVSWWIRSFVTAVLPVVYFVQILLMRGERFSIAFDCVWLFLSGCGLAVTVQAFSEFGAAAFYDVAAAAYLLTLGTALVLAASVTSILFYKG